jgi:hypothetical protein
MRHSSTHNRSIKRQRPFLLSFEKNSKFAPSQLFTAKKKKKSASRAGFEDETKMGPKRSRPLLLRGRTCSAGGCVVATRKLRVCQKTDKGGKKRGGATKLLAAMRRGADVATGHKGTGPGNSKCSKKNWCPFFFFFRGVDRHGALLTVSAQGSLS